jgi:aspartate racemase
MHIGLIGGIGPAATDYYYRGLIRAMAERDAPLDLTIAHADAPTLIGNLERGDDGAQAAIFATLIGQLKAAGAEAAAITSIGGSFCIDALRKISPLPLIDIIQEVDVALQRQSFEKVGLIGTRMAMETKFYGGLSAAEIVIPDEPELEQVHQNYVAMAMAGHVTDAQRQVFFSAARRLQEDQGADAIMLGGTDLFLAFDNQDCGVEIIDCAGIHINALARAAAGELGGVA